MEFRNIEIINYTTKFNETTKVVTHKILIKIGENVELKTFKTSLRDGFNLSITDNSYEPSPHTHYVRDFESIEFIQKLIFEHSDKSIIDTRVIKKSMTLKEIEEELGYEVVINGD